MLEIAPDKKNSFDKNYAEEIYRKYNESKAVDDSAIVEELRELFAGKKIMLIAPSKSISHVMNQLGAIAARPLSHSHNRTIQHQIPVSRKF